MAKPRPQVDLLLDREGLWTTRPGGGPAQTRSLPVPGGMAPRTVWRAPAAVELGPWLATVVDPPARTSTEPSNRAVALARLVSVAIRAAGERCVPVPYLLDWRWRVAPGPALAQELDDAVQGCLSAGAVLDEDPEARLREFVDDLATARLSETEPPLNRTGRASAVVAAQRWADHVIARASANARLVLVLNPPGNLDGWTLSALAVRLDEPTTRLPWNTADPGAFGTSQSCWLRCRPVESSMLERAWGQQLPDTAAALLSGGTADLADEQVLAFVDAVAPRLQRSGFDVVAPGGLLRPATVRRRLGAGTGTGALRVAGLGLDAQVLIDGEPLSDDDVSALAASKSELVSVKGRWLRIGPQDAQRLAALMRRLRRPVTAADLLADEAFEGIELATDQVLPQGLRPARRMPVPAEVQATLRPYQHEGLDWLTWLEDNEVGGVLADDMGLGKTLQVLSRIQADHAGPTLVVCPMTLVDTWARQAAQFTPQLRVTAFHGTARGPLSQVLSRADIVVTTYGLLARDEELEQVTWHRVVLDEAQAIKNPDTRAARAARALVATHRLVVTGTPVENHLGDLWSLLAFAQPGLLPRRKAFTSRFGGGDPDEMARLRAVISPFLLRRVKTDPGILPDLPDREVIRDDCLLTREQVGAYEAVVADMMGALEQLRQAAGSQADPAVMGRKAAVLGGISRLKQICVHPSLLTESRRALGDRSGKVSRLVELSGQIIDEGQAVVVFTQFASFVPDLAAHLRETLGVQVATLTGSDSRKARAATVAAFSDPEGPPILVASLKAGGTGLTLVRANHVIHLDRWWNPAVEDQASDRVWRIGQHQKVSVHVLVCPGTLEERIDEALSMKRELASSVIRSTDAAITELTDSELSDLVGLVRDRVLA